MFNSQFFPTPITTIEQMLDGEIIAGKIFLEPSGGKGDIVDYLLAHGAKDVLACEINDDLRKILATKCTILASDFLKVESSQISHIDYIVMNPPFDADEKHILHAYDIAPPECGYKANADEKSGDIIGERMTNLQIRDKLHVADRWERFSPRPMKRSVLKGIILSSLYHPPIAHPVNAFA